MLEESGKFLWGLVLIIVGAVILSILVDAFVSAVGALGYFLTHGGAALTFIVVVYFIWRAKR